jgi:hypothetical protein
MRLTQSEAQRIVDTLIKLNTALDVEFDGTLKQYNENGGHIGTYSMRLEDEEWVYDG